MLLGRGDAGQWDLLYDYNTVGTTSLQAGGTTRQSLAGMAVRYPEAASTTVSNQIRMQLLTLNGVWRRPYLGETGTGEPMTCETPPREEDPIWDSVNLPPNCFSVDTAFGPGANTGDPDQLTLFTVGKPATGAAVAKAPQPSFAGGPRVTYNGVDQSALSTCIADGKANCLTTVPGLAECVAARAMCNATAQSAPQAASAATRMTAAQALDQARATFRTVGAAKPAVITTKASSRAELRGLAGTETVYVVSSDAPVHSLSASADQTYHGYSATFDATSHRLLYACLGNACLK
jgi:hypothetical protein